MWKAVLVILKKMSKSGSSVLTSGFPQNYNVLLLFTFGGSNANELPLVEGFET